MTYPHQHACPRCKARYQQRPECCGSDIKCAFVTGTFSDENWNCATMNDLRDVVPLRSWASSGDEHFAAMPVEGGFILLSIYKNRGNTQWAMFMRNGTTLRPLTLADVEAALALYENTPPKE